MSGYRLARWRSSFVLARIISAGCSSNLLERRLIGTRPNVALSTPNSCWQTAQAL